MTFELSIPSKVILSLGVPVTCLLIYRLHHQRYKAGKIRCKKPIINSKGQYCFVRGTTVILQSDIEGEIERVFWKKRQTTEDIFTDIKIDNKKYIGGSVASPSLVIVSVGEEDVGSYICQATNNVGKGESREIKILVKDAAVVPMQSGFNQVIQVLEMTSRTNARIDLKLTLVNEVNHSIIGENGVIVNKSANGCDPKGFLEKIVESSRAAKDEAEKCVAMFGKIQEFCIQSEPDVRQIIVRFKVDDDKEPDPNFRDELQKQIARALNVPDERIINIELIRHCILVSFNIDGASFPWETSSLILAERFQTGLSDGSIRLIDDKGETLSVCKDSMIINVKTTSERAPVVSIGQGGYMMTAGEVTILTCTTLSPSPVTSVIWFRINKKEETKTAIEIDNKKYYGGSIETPSLVINNTRQEDEGMYMCRAKNKYGANESPSTFLLIYSKDGRETRKARNEHLAYEHDSTSTNSQTIPIGSEPMSINQEHIADHPRDSNLDKSLERQCSMTAKQEVMARNLNGTQDGTLISFGIASASFPWEPSSLMLAELFRSGLIDGSIRLAHKEEEQMSIRRDCTNIDIRAAPDDPDCSGKPIVCLGQGGYMKAVGEACVLACTVVSSSKVTSVKWFRKNDKRKTPSEVQIDNKKYYGGSVDSPSLVINNTDHSDEGLYLCRAENNYGSGESQSALLQTFKSNDAVKFKVHNIAENSIPRPCRQGRPIQRKMQRSRYY